MIRDCFILIRGRGKKDVFTDRIFMESGTLYDSDSNGIPIVVTDIVLRNAIIPDEIPFQIGHDGKTVGAAKNIHWNGYHALCGDIFVLPEFNKEVLQELQRGNSGLSTRFDDHERDFNTYRLVENIKLVHLALVLEPACLGAQLA